MDKLIKNIIENSTNKNDYRKIEGANEQQEYVINRLMNMVCETEADIIFKEMCICAMYKWIGKWDLPENR